MLSLYWKNKCKFCVNQTYVKHCNMKNKAHSLKLINTTIIIQFIKCFLIAFLVGIPNLPSIAQVWEGDYELKTQSEVDSFRLNCNCTTIDGNLTILGECKFR